MVRATRLSNLSNQLNAQNVAESSKTVQNQASQTNTDAKQNLMKLKKMSERAAENKQDLSITKDVLNKAASEIE